MTCCPSRRVTSYTPWMTVVVMFISAALAAAVGAAQPSTPERVSSTARPAFEQFVPPSAQIFVAISDARQLQALLATTRPERLVTLVSGAGMPQSTVDSKSVLQTFLGPTCRLEAEDLRTAQFAFAARSWSQLADGILFLQMPDEEAFERWFPGGGSRATRISPQARILRLEHTTVCTRGNILAAGRSQDGDALMRETIRLMAGRVSSALHVQKEYQRLLPYLPGRPLAMAYFSEPTPALGESGQVRTDDVQPGDLKETLAGLYARDGRLELAVRSNRKSPKRQSALLASTIARLGQLPQTTLAVWAGPIELLSGPEGMGGAPDRYLRTLRVLAASNGDDDDQFPDPGPDLIVAWDTDARQGMATPQIALLLPCGQAREWNDRFGRAAQGLLDRLYGFDPVGPEDAPAIELATYSDVAIATVDFSAFAAKSKFPAAKLLRNLQPSWAASGNWWMFALSRNHLERILDAEAGRLSRLSSVADFGRSLAADSRYNSILFLQPSSAAENVGAWLADAQAGRRSLLNPGTWSGDLVLRVIQPDRLGIGMHILQDPGSVLVARVYPQSAADGILEPGDRIIGIDGRLLDLDSPNMDLRTRWHAARTSQQRTMRVLRGDELLDIVLEFQAEPLVFPTLPPNVVAAAAEAVRAGSQVSSLVLTELETDDEHFAALLSVRLLPSAPPVEASASTSADPADKPN